MKVRTVVRASSYRDTAAATQFTLLVPVRHKDGVSRAELGTLT